MKKRGELPTLLNIEETAISRGRRMLRATFKSSREGIKDHHATYLDDGSVLGCDCDAGQRGIPCKHTESATVYFAIGTYHLGIYGALTPEQVRAEISSKELYLSHQPDESDRAACDLELIALCLIDARRSEAA